MIIFPDFACRPDSIDVWICDESQDIMRTTPVIDLGDGLAAEGALAADDDLPFPIGSYTVRAIERTIETLVATRSLNRL